MIDPLVNEWAARVGMKHRVEGADADVWMDLETAYRLSETPTGFDVSDRSRGSFHASARLRNLQDAERFLLLLLAMPWRSQLGLPSPLPPGLATETELLPRSAGFELAWGSGSGWFRSESDARRFSHVSTLDLAALSDVLESR